VANEIDLLAWGTGVRSWAEGATVVLPARLAEAADVLDAHVSSTAAPWLLLWDPALGDPDAEVVAELTRGRADAWHSGPLMGTSGLPEEHDYIHPIWYLGLDPTPGTEGVSWRCAPGALLVRTSVLRTLGGFDRAFHEPTGAALELGRRMIDRGAVTMYTPRLLPGRAVPVRPLTDHDRFTFLRRVFGRKWVNYAAARRIAAGHRPDHVAEALRSSGSACAARPRPGGDAVVTRPAGTAPRDADVSIVLPTLGRYDMLRPVLEQLRHQTIRAREVVVVDQNEPELRDHALYEDFADLGVRPIFQDQRGQWLARNAGVGASSGEWLAFLDDDSEVGPDFVEQHLEGLLRYDADLSTGASLAVIGAPIPANYAFFRVADQWDSGNGMCHRTLFERFGLFDQQFDRQRRGDAEFGLRVQVGGGLVIHNPHAIRVHLKGEHGGLRTFGSFDAFRHTDRTSPLPLPSMVYYSRRYHSRRQAREDLLIGLSQSIIPYELKRRATPVQWAGFAARELVHVPSTVRRVRTSLRLAEGMVAEGPHIPRLDA
jgi:GT2 family glycosyltransferase